MSWLFLGLVAPLLWAIANHTDKYLLTRYSKDGGIGALVILSALVSVVTLPVLGLVAPAAFGIGGTAAAALLGAGILQTLATLAYLYAMEKEEASVVAPLFQTIPLFGFVLGYFVLGEMLTGNQMIAAGIVLAGSSLLSLDIRGRSIRIRGRAVACMLVSALLFALAGVIFKKVAVAESFWIATFWNYAGVVIAGAMLFLVVKPYRKQFLHLLHSSTAEVLGLTSGAEVLTIAGSLAASYATLLAPIALVWVVTSSQPVFVLLIGIALTLRWPSVGQESLHRKDMVQKLAGVALIVLGSVLLAQQG